MKTIKLKKRVSSAFTLLELLVSMAVFTLLMMALMQFVNSAQKLWVGTDQKNAMFENARIALDFMSRDIECIFYEADKVPFWNDTANGRLCLVTITDNPPTGYTSRIVGTQYFRPSDDPFKLYICRIGSSSTSTNFYVSSIAGAGGGAAAANVAFGASLPLSTATGVQVMIPYVVGLSFSCYNKLFAANDPNQVPYAIVISISLIDKNTYTKWTAVDSTHTPSGPTYDNMVTPNVRTFTKTVIVGDKGQ